VEAILVTTATLEKKLKTFEKPVSNHLLKWLYLNLPPQPITSRQMHRAYADNVGTLMIELEMGGLTGEDKEAVLKYLKAVGPFIEQYEKKEFPSKDVTPEEMLRYLMEENNLSQYDLTDCVGAQPAVSYVLTGKRKLTREQIAKLARRFHVSEATFYPSSR
jgi:antitoxin component HigA of HigAB toxin-antitoxin module